MSWDYPTTVSPKNGSPGYLIPTDDNRRKLYIYILYKKHL